MSDNFTNWGGWNMPPGASENDPYFTDDEPEEDEGPEPAVCDPDHLNPAEGGNRASDDYW